MVGVNLLKKQFITIVLILLCLTIEIIPSCNSLVSPPQAEWNRTYSQDGFGFFGFSVLQTSEGGYLVGGMKAQKEYQRGRGDFWVNETALLVKTDSLGDWQWNKTYLNIPWISYLSQTWDNGYVFCNGGTVFTNYGLSQSNPTYFYKIDSLGNTHWNITFPFYEKSVIQTNDQGYLVLGYSSYYNSEFADLVKLSSIGTVELDAHYNLTELFGYYSQLSTAIAIDSNYLICGNNDTNGFILLTNSNGNILWNRTISFSSESNIKKETMFTNVFETSDKGLLLFGNYKEDNWDGFILKIDANGNHEWDLSYSSEALGGYASEDLRFISVTRMGEDDYVLTASRGDDYDLEQFFTMKVSGLGELEWVTGGFPSSSAVLTSDGGYAFVGIKISDSAFSWERNPNLWLAKITHDASTSPESTTKPNKPAPDSENLITAGIAISAIVIVTIIVYRKVHRKK
jgi:hypothetical protein